MGGLIAANLAATHPEMVRALILASSAAGFLSSPVQEDFRAQMRHMIENGDMTNLACVLTDRCFSDGFKLIHPTRYEYYLRVKMRTKPENLAGMFQSQRTPFDTSLLQNICCPALLVAGQYDIIAPLEVICQAQKAIPGARLEVLPTGHASMLEEVERFNTLVLEFLAQLQSNS
jgi:3-oxoadipate enol-lactonase